MLTVSPTIGLIYVLSQISDYLRTPKIHQVNKLIIWLNQNKNTNFSLLINNNNSLSMDYWLAGFVDADGGFMINYKKKRDKDKNRDIIKLTLTIEQRMVDFTSKETYELILNKIALLFKTKVGIRAQKSTGRWYYRIVATSHISRLAVIKYFAEFPLQSSKRLNFLDWKKASLIKMSNRNKVLSIEQKNIIYDIKENMNRKRIYYSWNHLIDSDLFNILD